MTERSPIPFQHSAAYWIQRAKLYRQRSDHAAALLLMRHAYQQQRSEDIAMQIAEIYFEMGCHTALVRTLNDILRADPGCAKAYYLIGLTALREKDEETADYALTMALKKGCDSATADHIQDILTDYPWHDPLSYRRSSRSYSLYLKAERTFRSGDANEAEALLRRAVRRGLCPEAEALLGRILLKRGDYACSIRHTRKALAHLPDQTETWLNLALACAMHHQPHLSLSAFLQALRHTRTITEWSATAETGQKLGLAKTVINVLTDALRRQPESNDLRYILAAMKAEAGLYSEAHDLLKLILDRDPADVGAALALRCLGRCPLSCRRDIHLAETFQPYLRLRSPRGDSSLRRLSHGLTISLGDISYRQVRSIASPLWKRLSPLQKRYCSLMTDWPNAFYRVIARKARLEVPPVAPLWPGCSSRRVRRMARYLSKDGTQ